MSNIYFSGYRAFTGFGGEDALNKATGWKHRCFSYAYVAPGGFHYSKVQETEMKYCLDHGIGIMLDSGGFSFFKQPEPEKLIKKYIDSYVAWINDLQKDPRRQLDFYVNVDYVQDAPKVFEVFKQLKRLGLTPVPVYHGDCEIDWMKRYVDQGHDFIGLGTMVDSNNKAQRYRFFSRCFEFAAKYNVRLHGFSCTSGNLYKFPWHSVDSTTWFQAAVNGLIVYIDPERRKVQQIHVSTTSNATKLLGAPRLCDMSKPVVDTIETLAKRFKIPLDALKVESFWRAVYNVRAFSEFAAESQPETGWKTLV